MDASYIALGISSCTLGLGITGFVFTARTGYVKNIKNEVDLLRAQLAECRKICDGCRREKEDLRKENFKLYRENAELHTKIRLLDERKR